MKSLPCELLNLVFIIALVHFSQAADQDRNQENEKRFSIEVKRSLRSDWYTPLDRSRRDTAGDDSDTLRTSLIIIFSVGITIGILLIVTICSVYVLYKARYGAFCCLKPKIRRLPQALHFESSSDCSEEESQPPGYDAAFLINESPPVYEDALQDRLIARGINTSDVALPEYQSSVNSEEGDHPEQENLVSPRTIDPETYVSSESEHTDPSVLLEDS